MVPSSVQPWLGVPSVPVSGVGHGHVDRVASGEVACWRHIQGRDGHDESLEDGIVVADGVDNVGSDHSSGPVDRRRIAEECVEVLDAC
jgi:hypothetical protein